VGGKQLDSVPQAPPVSVGARCIFDCCGNGVRRQNSSRRRGRIGHCVTVGQSECLAM
jgi:hypothetical protein